MQFTVPKGDMRRTEEIVKLIKKYAAEHTLEDSNNDGDVYDLTFKNKEDEEQFRAQTAELLKMI
jgi:hypothetical protein